MSALPPEGDIAECDIDVRFLPKADSCSAKTAAYSITSSAREISVGGTVRPSVFAVL